MAEPQFLAVLQAILGNPSGVLDAIASRLLNLPDTNVDFVVSTIKAENNLTRSALLGLLFDTLNPPKSECTVGPINPLRAPWSGFTIRDIVTLPTQQQRPVAHSVPGSTSTDAPTQVPMIVELLDVGLESRPDLVGVVETAIDGEPSESTQILRAFVAGFRGYRDCPDVSSGRHDLAALVGSIVSQRLANPRGFLETDWLTDIPWTAAMAAPLEKPTFGSIAPVYTTPCDQTLDTSVTSIPVRLAPAQESPGVGSGSGSGEQEIKSIQNLWALAIPREVQAAVDRMFLLKVILGQPAAQVIYAKVANEEPNDIRRFLGQANFSEQLTFYEFVRRCECYGPVFPGDNYAARLKTLAVGDKTLLRNILTDETMISLSHTLPINFVPWDNRTELVPSDIYLLKPIPKLGIAISAKVRVWQAQVQNYPFERLIAQEVLTSSLRAVLSPCDVSTFTPDPLLCVARTGRQPPSTSSQQISASANNNLLLVNSPSSSPAPTVTLYGDQSTNSQAAAAGPNVIYPGYIQLVVAQQAWIETQAPSISSQLVATSSPTEPQLGRKGYLTTLFPLGEMYLTIAALAKVPVNPKEIVLPLSRRIPTSTEDFLAWVNEKLFSFRSFRTIAERQALVPKIPAQYRIYLGITPPIVSAVQAFLSPQIVLRRALHLPGYRNFKQSFQLPRSIQITSWQGQFQSTGTQQLA